MKTIANKKSRSPLVTILTAIALGAIVFFLARSTSRPLVGIIDNQSSGTFYLQNVIFKFFVLIYSVLTILIVNKWSLKNYGFKQAENISYGKFILSATGITIASLIVGAIIFMGVLNHMFPTGNSKILPVPDSILQMILTIWVWSTICEEVLVRGLVQGYMQHLSAIKISRLSLPVIVSGLFFGAMHLSLINAGMGAWFVAFTVFNTTVIGLVAAYYREKSGSLVPAILVHFIANVVGAIPLIIKTIMS